MFHLCRTRPNTNEQDRKKVVEGPALEKIVPASQRDPDHAPGAPERNPMVFSKTGHFCLGETRTLDNCRNTSPPESRAHVRRSGRKGRGGKTIRKAVYGLPGSCLSSWSSLCPTQFPPFWMALAVPSTAFFRSW